jgi:hypothetical protein
MTNLLDPDPEFRGLTINELRAVVSGNSESVLRRGRAMLELGRRASSDSALLHEVAEMIRAPEYRRLITVGAVSISQLGAAGLVAGGGETSLAVARELVDEWQADEQSHFAWLMKSYGVIYP